MGGVGRCWEVLYGVGRCWECVGSVLRGVGRCWEVLGGVGRCWEVFLFKACMRAPIDSKCAPKRNKRVKCIPLNVPPVDILVYEIKHHKRFRGGSQNDYARVKKQINHLVYL